MPREHTLDWDTMSMQEILSLAIADEEEARSYYTRAASMTGNPHTRSMLLRLAEMERGHAETLKLELEELGLQRECEAGMAD